MTLLVVFVALLIPSFTLSSPTTAGAVPRSLLTHNLHDLIKQVDHQIHNESNGASNRHVDLIGSTVKLLAKVQDLPTASGDFQSDLKLKTIKSIHTKTTLVEICKMLKTKDVHECLEKISTLDMLVKLQTALNFYDSAVRHLG